VEAVADGRRAAMGIDELLRNSERRKDID